MSSNRRIRVGLLFGGRSGEHEVSIASARSVLLAADRGKYEMIPVRISKEGRWTVLPPLSRLGNLNQLGTLPGGAGALSPCSEGGNLLIDSDGRETQNDRVDVIFPLLHGVFGEDGTVQGLLELASVAYVGAEVLASAVGMDKVVMKQVFQQSGLRVVPWWSFSRHSWRKHPQTIIREIEERLGYPCFIKPANTGSSVGVHKAHHCEEIQNAIEQAAVLDLKIIAERAVPARELECGVLGNDEPEASVVGEVIPCHEFYDYEAKYIDEGSRIIIPAEIDSTLAQKIQEWSIRAFQAIDACSMARVDFFMDRGNGDLYLNEINTIPGFTPRSMFPMLWQATGLSYSKLIDRLIELALERHEQRKGTQGRI